MPPEKAILRYIKTRRLAHQGVEGERAAARSALASMEKKYPGIREAAERRDAQQAGPGPTAGWPNPGASPHPPGPDSQGNWENIFRYAQQVGNAVYGFAQQVGGAMLGRQLAARARVTTKVGRTGNLLVVLRITPNLYDRAMSELTPVQREAFVLGLTQLVETELRQLFEDVADDD